MLDNVMLVIEYVSLQTPTNSERNTQGYYGMIQINVTLILVDIKVEASITDKIREFAVVSEE
jgi:hypothetical protein